MIITYVKTLLKLRLDKSELKGIIMASYGSMIDFYDFIMFGFMAVYLCRRLFHNSLMSHKQTFILFSIFILGYVARLIGMRIYTKSVIKYKTTNILKLNTILMVISNLLLVIFPDVHLFIYNIIFFSVFTSRIIQGIASGIEMQASHHYIENKLKPENIKFAIFGIFAGYEFGQILAIFVFRCLHIFLSQQQMSSFGWRITFIISALISIIVYIIRKKYADKISNEQDKNTFTPTYKLIINHPRQIIISCILAGVKGCVTFLYLIFIPFLLYFNNSISPVTISRYLFLSNIIGISSAFLFNYILTFRNMVNITITLILFIIPCVIYWGWSFNHGKHLFFSITAISILSCFFAILIPRIIGSVFTSDIRFHGTTFSYHTGFILFAGITPLISAVVSYVSRDHFINLTHTIFYSGSIIYFSALSLSAAIILFFNKQHINYRTLRKSIITQNKKSAIKK